MDNYDEHDSVTKPPPHPRTRFLQLLAAAGGIICLAVLFEFLLTEISFNSNCWSNLTLRNLFTMPKVISVATLVIVFFLILVEFVVTTTQEYLHPTTTLSVYDWYDEALYLINYYIATFTVIRKWILSLIISHSPSLDDLTEMGIRLIGTSIFSFIVTVWLDWARRTAWFETQYEDIKSLLGDIKQMLRSLSIRAKIIIGIAFYIYANCQYMYSRYHANMANPQHMDMCFREYADASLIQWEYCLAQALWLEIPPPPPEELFIADEQPISVEYIIWPTGPGVTPTNWVKHIQYPTHKIKNRKTEEAVPLPPTTSLDWLEAYERKLFETSEPTSLPTLTMAFRAPDTRIYPAKPESSESGIFKGVHLRDYSKASSILSKIFSFTLSRQPEPTTTVNAFEARATHVPATPTEDKVWETWEVEERDLSAPTPQPVLSDQEKHRDDLEQCLNTWVLGLHETDAIFKNCGPCGRVEKSPAYKPCGDGEEGKKFLKMLEGFRKEKASEFEERRKNAAKVDFARMGGKRYWEEQEAPKTQMGFDGDDVFVRGY